LVGVGNSRKMPRPTGPVPMLDLGAASAYLLLIHFGVAGTRWRDTLVARLGEGPYRGAFSFASLLGLVWIIYAYRHAPTVHLWDQPLKVRPIAYLLVFVAFLFVVIGLATPSPTQVGGESKLSEGGDIARGMVRITRHPFLWGTALWALVHIIVTGDLASLIVFGSLLLLAIGGTVSIDAKRRRRFGSGWARFAQVTSGVPFAAILRGRNTIGAALSEIGIVRPLIAVLAYAAIFYFHGRLFGARLI
jgi:uncharacterized membrane protein